MPFKEEYIKYFFYTKNVEETQFSKSNISYMNFDTSVETVFIIHGWKNSYESPMPQTVKNAYLYSRDANVIIVDWSKFAKSNYITAKHSITNVGKMIGDFVAFMVQKLGLKIGSTAMVGHSLGAHIAGIAGRQLNGALYHITGNVL